MPKYELKIVTRYYKDLIIEAESEQQAIEKAWDELSCGADFCHNADVETEIYVENEEVENVENSMA